MFCLCDFFLGLGMELVVLYLLIPHARMRSVEVAVTADVQERAAR